ncbi:hypothetical protein LWI29_006094 [Acer saccharum]|uniref:Uncharacterized protein n=1 Tax=Acer saccharum TaxID=4024 RepID=A0AA39SNZ0_ACESA|nr:hypothetical protein LWI29_006094 [Acer saccharum]
MKNNPPTYFHTWNIVLYLDEYRRGEGNSISIFLCQSSIPVDTAVAVKFILRVKRSKAWKTQNLKQMSISSDTWMQRKNTY